MSGYMVIIQDANCNSRERCFVFPDMDSMNIHLVDFFSSGLITDDSHLCFGEISFVGSVDDYLSTLSDFSFCSLDPLPPLYLEINL